MLNTYLTLSLESFGINYGIWTLLLAVAVPLICAFSVFVCCRRAVASTKLTYFFIFMPLYIIITAILLTKPEEFAFRGVPLPAVSGFIAALAIGIAFLGTVILFCGNGTMKSAGRIALLPITLVFTVAEVATVYFTIQTNASLKPADGIIGVSNVFPFLAMDFGIEFLALGVFGIFLVAMFLCFLANKTRDEIRSDDIKYLHSEARKKHNMTDDVADGDCCCGNCQFCRRLRSTGTKVLCDKNGVVPFNHCCSYFTYDPLKRDVTPSDAEYSDVDEEAADSGKGAAAK